MGAGRAASARRNLTLAAGRRCRTGGIAGVDHVPALPDRISAAMAADSSLGPARRLTLGTLRAMPIAITLIGTTLMAGSASASLSPLADTPDRPHLRGGASQIIIPSAAPGAVSAIPRSRPSSPRRAETPQVGAPRPAVRPAMPPDAPASPPPPSTRTASTTAPHMPRPIPRPETLARQAAASQIQRVTLPARTSTGTQSALPGSTSLLGVLETSAGREALLRTGSGQVVKVTRGNMVEGWQVSSIDRNAIRLTRGSETRTLRMLSN